MMESKHTTNKKGDKVWFQINRGSFVMRVVNGQLMRKVHRFDGPAIERKRFNRYKWFINGREIDGEKYTSWLIDNGYDINNLSDEDKAFIMMVWG